MSIVEFSKASTTSNSQHPHQQQHNVHQFHHQMPPPPPSNNNNTSQPTTCNKKSLNKRLNQHVKKSFQQPYHPYQQQHQQQQQYNHQKKQQQQQQHVLFKEIPKTLNVTPLRRGRPPKRKSKDLEMNITRTDILTSSSSQQHSYNVEQLIQPFEKEFQIIHVNKKQKRILPNIDKSHQQQFRNATCNNEHANFNYINNNVNNHIMQNRSPPPSSFTFVNEYSNYGNESKLQNKIIETTQNCNTINYNNTNNTNNQMLNECNNVNNPSPIIATPTIINSNEIKQNKICRTSISIRELLN